MYTVDEGISNLHSIFIFSKFNILDKNFSALLKSYFKIEYESDSMKNYNHIFSNFQTFQ